MSTPTEAHRKLWITLFNLAHREILEDESSDGPATHLIAESEARAIAAAVSSLTCTHHNDQERAACPVCLVATLTDEMKRLKRDYEYEHKCLHEVRERCESWKQRAERAEDNLAALEQCHDDNCRGVVKIADSLATERARLDWVFRNCKVQANDYTTGNRDVYYVHDREDLSVAMKEDAK